MTAEFVTRALPEDLFKVREGSFDLDVLQTTAASLLAFGVRVDGLTHQLWRCEITMPPAARADWQRWQAFRAKLAGQAVLFTVRVPIKLLPLGAGGGFATDNDPLVITGTTITGTTILQGSTTARLAEAAPRYAEAVKMQFPAAVASTLVLRAGDVFSLGGNLHLVTDDVTTDASALARVPFRARLWKGEASGARVDFHKPACRMQLSGPNVGRVETDAARHGRTGFSAHEIPFV